MQLNFFDNLLGTTGSNESVEEDVRHKACKVCGDVHPVTEDYFPVAYTHASGTKHLTGVCYACTKQGAQTRSRLKKIHRKDYPDKCACCGRPESDTKRGFHLDHCYQTQTFRGWICEQCNRGIGNLGDNIEGLEKALEYMKRHRDGLRATTEANTVTPKDKLQKLHSQTNVWNSASHGHTGLFSFSAQN